MLTRIGHVFGWTGNILAGLFVVGGLGNYFGIYEWLTSWFIGGPTLVTDPAILKQLEGWSDAELIRRVSEGRKAELTTLIALLVAGVVIFLVGRALRYILSGPTRD